MIEVPGYQVMFVEWTLVICTLILLCLRIYARLNLKSTIVTFNDFFAILSWLSFLTAASIDTALYRSGYFEDAPATVYSLRLQYFDGGEYFWCPYAAKASMLCFYTDLVPRTMKKTRMLMWCTAIFTVVGFIATEGILFFSCIPISSNWSLDEKTQCSPSWSVPGYVVPYVFHLLTDVLIYTIPILVVRAVRLPSNQKIAVGLTFALGFLCVAFGVAVIAASWSVHNLGFGWIWGCLEQSWAVVIICAPSFKYFISKWDSSVRGTVIRKVGTSWVVSKNGGSGEGSEGTRSKLGLGGGGMFKTNISTSESSRAVFMQEGESEEEITASGNKGHHGSGGIVVNRTVEIELEDRRDINAGNREKDLEGGSSLSSVPSRS